MRTRSSQQKYHILFIETEFISLFINLLKFYQFLPTLILTNSYFLVIYFFNAPFRLDIPLNSKIKNIYLKVHSARSS